jgi:hypothetical protein
MRLLVISLSVLMLAYHLLPWKQEACEMLTIEKSGGVTVCDVGVAKFPVPAGWVPNHSTGDSAVILTRVNANPLDCDEMIVINISPPVTPKTKESADGYAGQYYGHVVLPPFTVDGEHAYRVSMSANSGQLEPRECIVVHHADKACFLVGGSKSKQGIWPTVKEVADSWTWK